MRAKDIMTTPVVTITSGRPVKEVAGLLVERGISAVPVVDERGALVGIVSEADLVPLETTPDPRSRARPDPHASRQAEVEATTTEGS
jgi:CBS domain-containing protein